MLCILFAGFNLHVFSFCCSLDTFPYAGTTTTCESLYMGVPCVTMAGSVHAHNVGVSLLSKVGEEPFLSAFPIIILLYTSFFLVGQGILFPFVPLPQCPVVDYHLHQETYP